MAFVWATKSEGVGLIVRAISFQDFQSVVLIHQRHRQTDGRTTCNLNTALCDTALCSSASHRAVKRLLDVLDAVWPPTMFKQFNSEAATARPWLSLLLGVILLRTVH